MPSPFAPLRQSERRSPGPDCGTLGYPLPNRSVTISGVRGSRKEVRRSVYAAFGNKEALFTAALERYLAGPGAFVAKALALPTAREVSRFTSSPAW